jgi:preprotein translocase subunit SecE
VTNHPRDTEEGEVAQSKRRRGQDVADEELDEVLDDATDDDAEDVADDAEDEPVRGRRRGGTATKVKKAGADTEQAVVRSDVRVGLFGRLIRFVREVVAELKKVIWPTRKELLTYAAVVIVFVTVVVTIVALLDAGFEWAVLKVFAGKK